VGIAAAMWWLGGCAHYSPKPMALEKTAEVFDARSLTNRERWDFEGLLQLALASHPSLAVARAQWGTANAGIKTAGARPNPTVGFTPGYNFDAIKPTTPWIPGMSIDFPIETAGKRAKRMEQAQFLSLASKYAVAVAAWQVRSNLRVALVEVFASDRRAGILAQQMEGQGRLLKLLEQRLTAGAIASNELLPMRVAQVRLQGEAAAARAAAAAARTHLAEALGVSGRALNGVQFAEDAIKFETQPSLEARAAALKGRADLLALLAKYEAAQAALRLEIAKQYPDLKLGSGYQWDQGESKWNLSASLEVPVFNRNQGPIAEAEARREEVGAQLLELQARVIGEIDGAFSQFAAAQQQVESARQTLGSVKEQSRLIAERLAAGAADQVELETARVEESVALLTMIDAESRMLNASAQVEAALQVPMESMREATMSSHP